MTTVVVTGVCSPLGRAVVARLVADRSVRRIVGIDRCAAGIGGNGRASVPGTPEPVDDRVEVVRADLRDPVLARVLRGADVVIHQGVPEALDGGGHAGETAVQGTRHVLDAAHAAGVGTVVYLSTALVYGAREVNPVPLTEDVRPAAGSAFPLARQAREAEDLVHRFASDHPECRVVVLRPVPVLGTGIDSAVTRHLEGLLLPMVRGYDPPVQFVDVRDVADAVVHVARDPRARGCYNVAADGWLTTDDVRHLLARPTLHLPVQTASVLAGLLYRWGVITTPPGALEYLMHPWVVDTSRLRALGWHPASSHRDILHQFVAEHGPWVTLGRVRVRVAHLVGGAVTAAAVATAAAAWVMWRRWLRPRARLRAARAPRATRRTPDRSSAPGPS